MLHNCSESCGWLVGFIAVLSFGSFGVPIRSTCNLNVDPLVLQSYKSLVCFLTCWLVIPLGESARFTSWGIISGIFWVPGATCGIYGIRNAGLALSVGIWSAIIVIASFIWGIFVFKERVKHVGSAVGAVFILIIGLIGMSKYSEPLRKEKVIMESKIRLLEESDVLLDKDASSEEDGIEMDVRHDVEVTSPGKVIKRRVIIDSKSNIDLKSIAEDQILLRLESSEPIPNSETDVRKDAATKGTAVPDELELEKDNEGVFYCFGVVLNRRQLGIIGAVINGAWGSNNIIPMHYAKTQGFFGAGYIISYSCGSMIVTIALWIIRYLVHLHRLDGNIKGAYDSMPSFHIREMWRPGLLAGFLYSLGQFCAIITVSVLGQGVGYSFVQTSMLVSGLWGIFYFSEVPDKNIMGWFLSSSITVFGIICLSYEHENTLH